MVTSRNAVLVSRRNVVHEVGELSMRCDRREIPEPIGDSSVVGTWFAIGIFRGAAVWTAALDYPAGGEGRSLSFMGALALIVTVERASGIVAPPSNDQPAVWFSLALGGLDVTQEGEKGIFTKRPRTIRLTGNGWTCDMSDVRRLMRSGRMMEARQELSLLEALRSHR